MKFFGGKELQPRGVPKEASEMPVYDEEEDEEEDVEEDVEDEDVVEVEEEEDVEEATYRRDFRPYHPFYTYDQHKKYLKKGRGLYVRYIGEEEVRNGLRKLGYICEPCEDDEWEDRFYTNIEIPWGEFLLLPGRIKVVQLGVCIGTYPTIRRLPVRKHRHGEKKT